MRFIIIFYSSLATISFIACVYMYLSIFGGWLAHDVNRSIYFANQIIVSINNYKLNHGYYPDSLDEIELASKQKPRTGDKRWLYRAEHNNFYLGFQDDDGYPCAWWNNTEAAWYFDE